MTKNIYLKFILTAIAVEILILIFKIDKSEFVYLNEYRAKLKADRIESKFRMPNAFLNADPQVIDVRVVGIELPNRTVMPVVLYNQVKNGYEQPLKVQVEQKK